MYGPILSPTDVIDDPQALVNDFFAEVDQPGRRPIRTINSPYKFCEDPASIKSTTPALGEQTDEILGDARLQRGGALAAKLREAEGHPDR